MPSSSSSCYAVFGLGVAGRAAAARLVAEGMTVYAWDDRAPQAHAAKLPGVTLSAPENWPWTTLTALVLSPGVPLTHPAPHPVVRRAQETGCTVIGEAELLQRLSPEARYIGITGTNGKSTTTALLGHLLTRALGAERVAVGGNLGTPALALPRMGADGVYVLELSSFQLDLSRRLHCNVAVWLNITPDHLDRHGDMAGYVAAKAYLPAQQDAEDTFIIGIDDCYSRDVAQRTAARSSGPRVVRVSLTGEDADVTVDARGALHIPSSSLQTGAEEARLPLTPYLSLPGVHNWQNIACAVAAARAFGLSTDAITPHLATFPGLPHRLQRIAEIEGVAFVNDSKATNAESTARALACYPEDCYWIAGGRAKAGGIASLSPYFSRLRHAFLIGEAEAEFARTLDGHTLYTRCGALENAVRDAYAKARSDMAEDVSARPVILLSPACASFDQWPNFEARGEGFCAVVQALEAEVSSYSHLT